MAHSIQWQGGKILWPGGTQPNKIAFDPACCCSGGDCSWVILWSPDPPPGGSFISGFGPYSGSVTVTDVYLDVFPGMPASDICVSVNGEPPQTVHPAGMLRWRNPHPGTPITVTVTITCGACPS